MINIGLFNPCAITELREAGKRGCKSQSRAADPVYYSCLSENHMHQTASVEGVKTEVFLNLGYSLKSSISTFFSLMLLIIK